MTARRTMPRRRTRLSLLAASALVALTGCGAVHPGVAAVVGSTTITHDRVDELAAALCSANVGGAQARGEQIPEVPTRGTREDAINVLIDTRISHLFGEQENADPNLQMVSQALTQNEAGIRLLPEDQRADFREALREFAEGQLMLVEIGRRSLEQQGRTDVTDDQALAEGQRLRSEFVDSIEIEVDPRYGSFEDGVVKPDAADLSVPVSDEVGLSDLPASQKCS